MRFGRALGIARVFKILAVVTLFGGALTLGAGLAEMQNTTDAFESESEGAFAIVVVVTTVATAAMFAFFGYVLDVLVELYAQAWHTREAIRSRRD